MAVLNDLPYETLVELLSLLPGSDLVSTSRVSRHFHNLSQPLLYRAPFLAKTRTTVSTNASCSLGIFLRTLLTRGREPLGFCVRSLHVELNDTAPAFEYPDDTKARMTTIASKLIIPSPFATRSAQLMILLELLPQLHTLHISPPNTRFIECAYRLPSGLRSLREIHYVPTEEIDFVKWKRILRTMQLPFIQRMFIPSGIAEYRPVPEVYAATGRSTVTHMRFSRVSTSTAVEPVYTTWMLYRILRVPIALTHFSYTAVEFYCDEDRPQFMKMLLAVQSSLQYLHMDFRNVIEVRNEVPEEELLPYDQGSLRDWPVLRTLSCSLLPLLGDTGVTPRLMDRLPPSLRELEVLPDPVWVAFEPAEHVLEVLAQKTWAVPRLEKLAVVVSSGRSQSAINETAAACEEAGVAFVEESFCW